jgi:hypothetical protein
MVYKITYSRIGRAGEYIQDTWYGQLHEAKIKHAQMHRFWDLLKMISCSRIKKV